MMMEKLAELRERLHPLPDEAGKASGPAQTKGLRWYHKALVVPMLTIAIFGASLTVSEQAQATSDAQWDAYNCYWDWYGGYYTMWGCASPFMNLWMYQTVAWNGQQYVYTGDVYVSEDGGYTWQSWYQWATSTTPQNEAVWSAMGPIAEDIGNIGAIWTKSN